MNAKGGSMPPLESICADLAAMIHSTDAALIENSEMPVGGVTLVRLPIWVWTAAKINMGRKGASVDGTSPVMPVRLLWDGGSVLAIPSGEKVSLSWRMVGLGHDESGTASVHISEDNGVHVEGGPDLPLAPVVETILNIRVLASRLRGLINTGKDARWHLITGLEGYTRHRLTIANYAVAHELGGSSHDRSFSAVLDDISIDDLVSELLFGDGADSSVTRMIDRALEPTKFRGVDPLRYFAVAIRARAEEAIRRRIGDPKVGPKVRRVMEISGAKSIEELLAAYREAFPNDSLAHKRAIAALTAGPEVSAHQAVFRDTVEGVPAL